MECILNLHFHAAVCNHADLVCYKLNNNIAFGDNYAYRPISLTQIDELTPENSYTKGNIDITI